MLSLLYIRRVVNTTLMNFLLPNSFKRIGAVIAPSGFAIWLCMQFGYVTRLLTFLFGERLAEGSVPPYHLVNVICAVVSFLSFLAGVFFLTFSREKIEDELVQKTRLESFQFAALVQIVFLITGFISMMVYKEPGDGGLMLFFIAVIFTFWLSFLARFHYIFHIRLKQ